MISCDASMIVLANINRPLSICSYIMSEMVFVRTNVSTLTATDNHVLHRPAVIIIIKIIIRELLRIMTIKMGIKPMDSSVSHLQCDTDESSCGFFVRQMRGRSLHVWRVEEQ